MKKVIFLSFVSSLIVTLSCKKDFVVENIDNKTLTINAPANNLVTPNNVVTFWWEPLSGAEKYNLQVVKPNFANLTQLVVDTNVTTTKFNLSLQPGNYQWRIKATNAGHATAFQTFSLKVDSSNVLTNQLVIPVTPLTGYITRDKTINFSWNNLYSATSYSIEIKQNNTVITSTTSSINSFQYIFPITSAANYTCSWRVKALNASSISQFNTSQTFTIDLLPPPVSTPTTPASSGSVSPFVKDTTTLVWKRLGGNDTKADSLFIYSDASFANLVKRSVVSDSKIKINAIDPTNPLSAGTSTASAIQYYWRLKSVDSLGNTSGFSSSLGFLLY